ncbi:branched-chain amino acid ABC transporter permease [Cytobacillus sp. FSL W7-1323]|mgnify:CR=1 FL=1|uniref:Branched-chain amino acid ABC transporter permease n=1 Tax=Cytobacillus kochii TaxID=859143 RepID=A0A248TDZ9_9BACI|nr:MULTISPECIES: branched-chain amino acid ABC transporter permease [Cytobacillus]ASV66448.1 branched-chain amino acid ABC transporter permease [Cytobacillus kochii]MCA1025107.1 branched-chain amino acid ABC transporter permease [Cytobacillus kochii]MCM3324150.1 branched-chain amino acid ABC transporter permease [Cytobacillus kochii]MCM3346447.1 branched-chain amino acid ABC transporter permease [Cytobacillus kochii]MDM5206745.1 branched-chain amino acid ABC transporter permease [Cytobacillus 
MLIEQLINGLTLGSIYAIVALGFTLVFGVLGIINMAHGEIFMFGAFIGVMITSTLNAPLWVAFLGAIIITAIMGYLLERFALRPLRHKQGVSHLAPLISTIGVSILLENLSHHLFGAGNHPFRTSFAEISFQIGSITVYLVQIVIFVISIVLMLVLTFWLGKTRAGKALRATAENLETASLLGVDTKKTILMTVIIASAMGGIAGILVGMAFNSVTPQMGLSMGLKGLAIIILGGMGSVRGAMFGGLILGLAETFIVVYGDSGYRDAIAFLAIIIILLIRPQGLFGQKIST